MIQKRRIDENDFIMKFGVDDIPQADWAWRVIAGEDGGRRQHDECRQGFHEYVWMPEVWEHVCFFCLAVEEVNSEDLGFDSDDEWLFGRPNVKHGRFLADELEPMYDPDSQNEDTDED